MVVGASLDAIMEDKELSFPNNFVRFPWIKEFSYATPSEITRTNKHVFFLHPTHAYSSTKIFSNPYHGPFRPTCPHGCFFFPIIIHHRGLLVYTDALFPLPRPIRANPSTCTFSFHWHSTGSLTRPHRHFLSYTGQVKTF